MKKKGSNCIDYGNEILAFRQFTKKQDIKSKRLSKDEVEQYLNSRNRSSYAYGLMEKLGYIETSFDEIIEYDYEMQEYPRVEFLYRFI